MHDLITVQAGGQLQGTLRVPGDKSISHRAILLGSIAEGTTEIEGLLEAGDTLSTINAMRAMGVKIEHLAPGKWQIHGVGLKGLQAPKSVIDCGNSGTLMRLLAGILAGQSFDSELSGDASLLRRPMGRIVEPLRLMGAAIEMQPTGTAPLKITGAQNLKGIEYELPMVSAQVKSCLLLASLYAQGTSIITEPMISRNHTELMLEAFAQPLDRQRPYVKMQSQGRLEARSLAIPGDISAAAFFMVGACIAPGSEVLLENVSMNPTRMGIINILTMMGAKIMLNNERRVGGEHIADIQVRYAPLYGIEVPMEQVPLAIDEFPILFIAAAMASGVTTVRGAQELRVKESDRIACMAKGLTAMGVPVEVREDGLMIEGVKKLHGAEVDGNDDHRIAMAFAIAGLASSEPVIIKNCAKVATSYPSFVHDAQSLGLMVNTVLP
jgi:3-phosphoshikimate 1-carboxyvinyltransferase